MFFVTKFITREHIVFTAKSCHNYVILFDILQSCFCSKVWFNHSSNCYLEIAQTHNCVGCMAKLVPSLRRYLQFANYILKERSMEGKGMRETDSRN